MNVYFQYFSGFDLQQWGSPCAASDLVHFRQRIGEDGVENIFKHSIDKHGNYILSATTSIKGGQV